MNNRRSLGLGLLGLAFFAASCFGNPSTLGLPCENDSACFDGLVCGASNVCVEPSAADAADTGNGDGEPGDGDGDPGDGDGDTTGDGDGDTTGDGDGDTTGDGDGDTTGDGDGDTGEPVCGNGIREGVEVCDGMDLNGMTCADFEYGGGMLGCNDECQLDITACCLVSGQACQPLQNECCEAFSCLNLMLECG